MRTVIKRLKVPRPAHFAPWVGVVFRWTLGGGGWLLAAYFGWFVK